MASLNFVAKLHKLDNYCKPGKVMCRSEADFEKKLQELGPSWDLNPGPSDPLLPTKPVGRMI